MYFNIKNRIFVHKFFILLPLLLCTANYAKEYIFTLLFAFLHELAHFFAAVICREKVKRIFIMPYGFELRINMPNIKNEFFISASGPLFSLLLSVVFLIIPQKKYFCTNFFLFLLNIFPAVPLDGGRMLKLFLWKKHGALQGNAILKKISRIIACTFVLFGVITLNLWLLIIASVIFRRAHTLSASPFYKKRTSPAPVRFFTCLPYDSPTSLLRRFSPYYNAAFVVLKTNLIIYEEDIVRLLLLGQYGSVGELLAFESSG